MPITASLLTTASKLIEDHGITGVLTILLLAILWFFNRQLDRQREERKSWTETSTTMHKQSLTTLDKNTQALTELSTIVKLTGKII